MVYLNRISGLVWKQLGPALRSFRTALQIWLPLAGRAIAVMMSGREETEDHRDGDDVAGDDNDPSYWC